MQSSTLMPSAGRSNIIAASILAAGLVVSALIIAHPNLSLNWPPLSTDSVAEQFEGQARDKMAGKTHYHFGRKRTLQEVSVEKVNYSATNRTYIVEYKLDWGGGDSNYNACGFNSNADTFAGICDLGDNGGSRGNQGSVKSTTITLK